MEANAAANDHALAPVFRDVQSWERRSWDLVESFSQIRKEFPMRFSGEFRVIVVGAQRPLRGVIRDAIYLISHEALCNAFRHSNATDIEVELEYGASELRVLVRDDGCGIDPKILCSNCDGHWGLSWMKEQSDRIGGKLRVLSHAGAGTEIELCVPGRVAYDPASREITAGWLSRLFS
jgi:signal transduction histidine kinase